MHQKHPWEEAGWVRAVVKPRGWDFWKTPPEDARVKQREEKEEAYADLDSRGLCHRCLLYRYDMDKARSMSVAADTLVERGMVFQPWTTLLMEPESMGEPSGIANRVLVLAFSSEAELVMFRLLME